MGFRKVQFALRWFAFLRGLPHGQGVLVLVLSSFVPCGLQPRRRHRSTHHTANTGWLVGWKGRMPGLDSLCGVSDIKHVKSRSREKEARDLLEKLADQVSFSAPWRGCYSSSSRTHPCLRRQVPSSAFILQQPLPLQQCSCVIPSIASTFCWYVFCSNLRICFGFARRSLKF